jgi:hypothetical protein
MFMDTSRPNPHLRMSALRVLVYSLYVYLIGVKFFLFHLDMEKYLLLTSDTTTKNEKQNPREIIHVRDKALIRLPLYTLSPWPACN